VRLSLDPSTDPGDYQFVHQVRTRFAETDAMGVIHHGSYAPYLEEARVAMLRHAGHSYDELHGAGTDLVVLELYVRFRRPLRFDEVVDIWVTVGALTAATFQMAYLLEVEGETRSTAVSVHGAVSTGGRPSRLPKWLAALGQPGPGTS
jgi:acyl-CoA thioester hydrolase